MELIGQSALCSVVTKGGAILKRVRVGLMLVFAKATATGSETGLGVPARDVWGWERWENIDDVSVLFSGD